MLLSSYFLRKDFFFFLITLSLSYYAFICFVIFLFLSFFPPFGFICRFYPICLYVFAYFFLAFFSLLPPSCSFYICMSLYMCVCEFLSAPISPFYFSERISMIVFGFLKKIIIINVLKGQRITNSTALHTRGHNKRTQLGQQRKRNIH